jgi:hypothetical protein
MVDYVAILKKAVPVFGGRSLSQISRTSVCRKSINVLDAQYRGAHPSASTEEIERELRQLVLAVQAVESTFDATWANWSISGAVFRGRRVHRKERRRGGREVEATIGADQ